jgi:hypothetical protein
MDLFRFRDLEEKIKLEINNLQKSAQELADKPEHQKIVEAICQKID